MKMHSMAAKRGAAVSSATIAIPGEEPTMLFDKHIEPRCAYCQWATPLEEEQMICVKKGIVACGGSCRRFRYDPLKRTPPKPLAASFAHLKDEDFTL